MQTRIDMQNTASPENGGCPCLHRVWSGFSVAFVLFVCTVGAAASDAARHLQRQQQMAEERHAEMAERARLERLRLQRDRRRAAAHASMPDTMHASTPSPSTADLICPVVPDEGALRRTWRGPLDDRSASALPMSRSPAAGQRGITRTALASAPAPYGLRANGNAVGSADRWLAATSDAPGRTHLVPFVSSASDPQRQGFVRVINHSARSGEVRIAATDDAGNARAPLALPIAAGAAMHFNSNELEAGNANKGIAGGTGPGQGDWRLELASDLDLEVLAYVRAEGGFLTAMHDVAPEEDGAHRVLFLNPGSNVSQLSLLRVMNLGASAARVEVEGVDDRAAPAASAVAFEIPAFASRTLTAAELEDGASDLEGAFGDGGGKWRLSIRSAQPIRVQSLLSSPSGHLTNLSTAPPGGAGVAHEVPLFPSASDAAGRQGFARVVNRSDEDAVVTIEARDDSTWEYEPLTLTVPAGRAVHFNSDDLETGNESKSLVGGTGSGEGDWRLTLTSESDIRVLSYIRHSADGFLTSMHDAAPAWRNRHRVPIFNPGSNQGQVSRLRVANGAGAEALATITGTDDLGASPGVPVRAAIPAGGSRLFTAQELESGGEGFEGALGDGKGKWRLRIESTRPVRVQSLLSSPTGHLTNLSSAPRGAGPETAAEAFEALVSPLVQSTCVNCHVAGGVSGNTRLVFVREAEDEDHLATNLKVFETFVDEVENGANRVLSKIQGVEHGGGPVAPAGTEAFAAMGTFLRLLGEDVAGGAPVTVATLFDGVTMESARKTLWRAAIVFAGRIPTEAEYASIETGSSSALRRAIRGLMTGPGFHEFLIRASNDRLLTDRDDLQGLGLIDLTAYLFVAYQNLYQERTGDPAYGEWFWETDYGIQRAPLELIAHVAENDLPYTEILTADYIMANPRAAEAYGAPTTFSDRTDMHEFQPSEIVSYYRNHDSKVIEDGRVVDPGILATDYPHAGILNTTVFLGRYPTTATNRNRARARWTYYHFLGLDVEKSASRTTDPVALADRNNPTMHNPACTVCHSVLDPVAGAFQDYDEGGNYLSAHGGLDSLDEFYKQPQHSAVVDVASTSYGSRQTVAGDVRLSRDGFLYVQFANDHWDENTGADRNLFVDKVVVREVANGNPIYTVELEDLTEEDLGPDDCGLATDDTHFAFYGECRLRFAVDVPVDGATYRVEAVAWADQAGDELAKLAFGSILYRHGDTWYRDMRKPGFDGQLAPSADDSLQWLATKIVADPRFADAAVKFWWPSVMGAGIAEPPAQGDAGFDGALLASNAQAAEAARLAHGFRSGFHGGKAFNLKDLLTEAVLSKWFRADQLTGDDPLRTVALAGAGARRLLTPKELSRKTAALTGFDWKRHKYATSKFFPKEALNWTNNRYEYGLLYGRIDSGGIRKRGRDFTSVMAGVAERHAAATACPVVMKDFYLVNDSDRRLFGGITASTTPTLEFSAFREIAVSSQSSPATVSVEGALRQGRATVTLSGPWSERDNWSLHLDRLAIRDAQGQEVFSRELEDVVDVTGCGGNLADGDHFAFNCWGSMDVPVDIPADGRYDIEVVVWAVDWADERGDELPRLEVLVNADDVEGSAGARAIKTKLAELHDKLLGVEAHVDSPDVLGAYELFVGAWRNGRESEDFDFRSMRCDWLDDQHYLDDTLDDALVGDGEWYHWNGDRVNAHFETIDWSDAQYVARAWALVLAHLLTDPRYLHL